MQMLHHKGHKGHEGNAKEARAGGSLKAIRVRLLAQVGMSIQSKRFTADDAKGTSEAKSSLATAFAFLRCSFVSFVSFVLKASRFAYREWRNQHRHSCICGHLPLYPPTDFC
jgi:hypothetical protein